MRDCHTIRQNLIRNIERCLAQKEDPYQRAHLARVWSMSEQEFALWWDPLMDSWVDQKGNLLPIEWFWNRASDVVYTPVRAADVQAPPPADIEVLREFVLERIRERAYKLRYDLGMPAAADTELEQIPAVRTMSEAEIEEFCKTFDLGVM